MIVADPSDVLDYSWDFAPLLDDAETIEAGPTIVSTPAGLTITPSGKPAPAVNGQKVVAWLAGGVVGQTYDVVCHVVTSLDREWDLTLQLYIADR